MSKTQTLVWTIVCSMGGIFCLVIGLGMVSPACFIVAAAFGMRWGFQLMRDYGLSHAVDEATPDKAELTSAMTTPGSHRLFVPPQHPSALENR